MYQFPIIMFIFSLYAYYSYNYKKKLRFLNNTVLKYTNEIYGMSDNESDIDTESNSDLDSESDNEQKYEYYMGQKDD
jgi:hypothetical protein